MGEAMTDLTRLLVVREIQENESGAALLFQQGGQGRLSRHDANYTTHLRLARRSHERQQPIGVTFGDGHVITELIRADSDVPMQLWEEAADHARLLFQGHDGAFRLKPDHPESVRIRALLTEAIRQKARVWFIAQKPDMALLEVLPFATTGESIMGSWKLFVRLLEDDHYQILDSPDLPGIYSRQSQLNVTGPHKLEIPRGLLTKAEYLRWKADLCEKGDKIADLFGI
jgi:hypothetical protein